MNGSSTTGVSCRTPALDGEALEACDHVQCQLPLAALHPQILAPRAGSVEWPQSSHLDCDPLGPSYIRRLEARGRAKKGVAAYRYQLEATLKIAKELTGKSMSLEEIFGDRELLGRVLTADIAPARGGQVSRWTLAQRRSAARSFARLVSPELRTSLGCDPEDRINEALQIVAERVGGGYRLTGGRPRGRGGHTPERGSVQAIIEAAGSAPGYRGLRNRVFFEILARTGTRINALRTLEGRDGVLMPSGRMRLFVHDKGKEEPREVELDPELTERLETYILVFNQLAAGRRWGARIDIGRPGPLWRNSQRGAWSYRAIVTELNQACDQAGIQRISPHALRRAFATDAASLLPRHVVALAGGWRGLERLDDHYIHARSSDIWRKFGWNERSQPAVMALDQEHDEAARSIRS